MKQEETHDKGRRDFLKTAAVATIAATACGSLACSCSSKKPHAGDKVKLPLT
jgi:nitrous oxide reductase